MLGALIGSLRVRRWIKNLPFFAALLFSRHAADWEMWEPSLAGFALLCLAAGGNYLVDDLRDVEDDRRHPVKRRRPIAEGRLSPGAAALAAVFLLAGSIAGSFALSFRFGFALAAFVGLGLAYSFGLKRVPIVDLFLQAFRFLVRMVAGAVLIRVEISGWFFLCGLLLSLFIALSKRRYDITSQTAPATVQTANYSTYVIDQMIAVVTSATLVAYGLYTFSDQTTLKVGSRALIYTIPFVLYGIFRFLYLIYQKESVRSPEKEIFLDWPLMLNVGCYLAVVAIILHAR